MEVIGRVGLDSLIFTQEDTGRYGYNKKFSYGGILNIYYSTARSEMGIHVEMSGQGVRKFETLFESNGLTWFDVFSDLNSFVRFSRIDLALDEFEGLVSFEDVIGKIERGEHVGKCRSFKIIAGRDSKGNHTGTTIYMGSNKSDEMLRVYEKKYEREQKGYEVNAEVWNRWELVLKHEKANSFVKELLENNYDFGRLFKGVLADFIRFVDQSGDSNKRRWPTSSWWNEFLETVEPVRLKGKEYQPSLVKTLNWIESNTLTAIKGFDMIAKQEQFDFLGLLHDADVDSYNHDKAEKMKLEYDGLDKIEKAKFKNRLKKIGKNF